MQITNSHTHTHTQPSPAKAANILGYNILLRVNRDDLLCLYLYSYTSWTKCKGRTTCRVHVPNKSIKFSTRGHARCVAQRTKLAISNKNICY
jgi:hypothetical protein